MACILPVLVPLQDLILCTLRAMRSRRASTLAGLPHLATERRGLLSNTQYLCPGFLLSQHYRNFAAKRVSSSWTQVCHTTRTVRPARSAPASDSSRYSPRQHATTPGGEPVGRPGRISMPANPVALAEYCSEFRHLIAGRRERTTCAFVSALG